MIDTTQLFNYFAALWGVFALLGFFMFYRGHNSAYKRRLYPWYIVSGGILIATFMLLMTFPHWKGGKPPLMIFIGLPFIAIIGYVNLKVVKFCDRCGSIAAPKGGFAPLTNCPKCGAPLK